MAAEVKVAIAGAGRGIGAACARALAGKAELILCARTAAEVQAVARETGARAVVADLSTEAGAEEFAKAAGAVHLAIVCVGAAHRAGGRGEARRETPFEDFFQNALRPALAGGPLFAYDAPDHACRAE